MSFARRHMTVAVGAVLALAYLIYVTLVLVGAIPAMVFPVYIGLVVLGAIPALTFPIYYSVKVKWWRLTSPEARETAGHLVMFSTCFALLYVRGGITLASPAGRAAVVEQSAASAAFLMFIALFAAAMVWHRVWLFHKGRRAMPHEEGGR